MKAKMIKLCNLAKDIRHPTYFVLIPLLYEKFNLLLVISHQKKDGVVLQHFFLFYKNKGKSEISQKRNQVHFRVKVPT